MNTPAANAPMMSASPIRSDRKAKQKQSARPNTSSVSSGRPVRAANLTSGADRKCPKAAAATRNTAAWTTMPRIIARAQPSPPVEAAVGPASDHSPHDETQDVVEDGGAENDLALGTLRCLEVLQDPRRDTHARRRQRRSDEDVNERGLVGKQPGGHQASEDDRRHHADHGDQDC